MKLLGQRHIDKIKVMEDFLKDNLNQDIKSFIKEEYEENPLFPTFIRIVENDFDQENVDFLKEKLGNMNRFRDQRTAEEYACDLLLGWITEDSIIKLINKLGYNCSIISDDKKREFLKRPTTKVDILIKSKEGKEILIELVADNTGFWKKTKKLHLREQKYERLLKQNGVLFGLDFTNKDFFVYKVKDLKVSKKIDRHFMYGGKPATEISLKETQYSPFSKMKEKLKDFFKNF